MDDLINIVKSGSNSAMGGGINFKVILILAKDVETFPAVSVDEVTIIDDIVMKTGKEIHIFEVTAKETDPKLNIEGEDDARRIKQTFAVSRPGHDKEITQFLNSHLNADFYILSSHCRDGKRLLYGSPCDPMKIADGEQVFKEATKLALTFEGGDGRAPFFYEGALTPVDLM